MFFIKEKSYNDIIEEIKSKLTEDKKENISYLKKQAKKYKNHKMNEAILKEIGKLLFEYYSVVSYCDDKNSCQFDGQNELNPEFLFPVQYSNSLIASY